MQRKQNTQKQIRTSKTVVRGQRINIDGLYNQLKNAIDQRINYQRKQKELWKYIHRTKQNCSIEMDKISNGIGKSTNEINHVISQLCKYKKTHKAMKLANDYLSKEIDRIEKIIEDRNQIIDDVECGYTYLRRSDGVKTTDTTSQRNYVKLKKEQKERLVKWKQYISRYI